MANVSSINSNKNMSSQIEPTNIISDRNIWYFRLIVNKVDDNLNGSKNVAKCKIRKRYVFWSITKILNPFIVHITSTLQSLWNVAASPSTFKCIKITEKVSKLPNFVD